MSFISTIIYLINWLFSFGILNSFWNFPLLGLGGPPPPPKRMRMTPKLVLQALPLKEKKNDI